MGELLIVTGPPGSGKSTVAPRLAEHRSPSVLIDGDEFFRFLRPGRTEPWPTAETCLDRVVNRIGHGFTDEAATRHMHGEFETAVLARRHVVDEFTGDSSELVESIVERVESGQLAYPG